LALRPCLLAALLASGLAACAGSSPDAPSAAADASEAATAPSDSAGGASRSTAATAETAAVPVDPAETAPDADASPEQAAPAAETSDAAPEPGAGSDAEVDQSAAALEPPPPAEPLAAPAGDGNDSAPEDLAAGEGAEADLPPVAPEAPATQSAATETAAVDRLPALPPGAGLASGRPYVTIRFNRSNVGYEPALAAAVRRAVARRPNVAFDLVAVTPQAATAEEAESRAALAQSQAAAVMHSLAALGIGPDRVSLQPWDGPPSDIHEIRLYIR
jgi:hypothetical protein